MKTLCRRMLFVLFLLVSLGLAAQDASQITNHHVGRVMDWSSRHVIVSGGLSDTNLDSAAHEPRVLFRLAERNLVRASGNRFDFRHPEDPGRHHSRPVTVDDTSVTTMKKNNLKVDWSVPLGNGVVAANMFPAKYSFDITAAPSCTNDYVVFGLNVASSATQANLLGITNLYSGTAPTGCLRCRSDRQLGLPRQHCGGKNCYFPRDFAGWATNRLCGKRDNVSHLSCTYVESGSRNLRDRRSRSYPQRLLHGYCCCSDQFLSEVPDLVSDRDRHIRLSLG